MKRNIIPIKNDTLSEYWKRCEGRFLDGWYAKSLKYIQKNMPVELFLSWENGGYIVSSK